METVFHLLARQLKHDVKAVASGGSHIEKLEAFEAEKNAVIERIRKMQLDPSSMMSGGRRKTTRSVKRRRRATKKHR